MYYLPALIVTVVNTRPAFSFTLFGSTPLDDLGILTDLTCVSVGSPYLGG